VLSISLDTLVAVSPLLGEEQEDRAAIREAQDPALVERVGAAASAPLPRRAAEGRHFVVAPLDILVSRGPDGRPRFQLAELNGTGIGRPAVGPAGLRRRLAAADSRRVLRARKPPGPAR